MFLLHFTIPANLTSHLGKEKLRDEEIFSVHWLKCGYTPYILIQTDPASLRNECWVLYNHLQITFAIVPVYGNNT